MCVVEEGVSINVKFNVMIKYLAAGEDYEKW